MTKGKSTELEKIHLKTERCLACPRLRKYCLSIAESKRKSFSTESYWGKPVSGFGDPQAQLVIVGLAPAAHGANRTGRIFTGDRSGQWLYRALHKAGFANQATFERADDGLRLKNAYVTCVVKCAPPDNKPSPVEINRCGELLAQEIRALKNTRVWVALGQVALNGLWPHLLSLGIVNGMKKPKFKHGGELDLRGGQKLLLSYHPSQQNTFTGRLTEPMFDSIFHQARCTLSL